MDAIQRAEKINKLSDEIGNAICNLANIVEDDNDACYEPEERGRGSNALGIIVFEDGSGYLAEFQHPINSDPLSNHHIVFGFKSPEELQGWFRENCSERSLID